MQFVSFAPLGTITGGDSLSQFLNSIYDFPWPNDLLKTRRSSVYSQNSTSSGGPGRVFYKQSIGWRVALGEEIDSYTPIEVKLSIEAFLFNIRETFFSSLVAHSLKLIFLFSV